MPESLQPMHEPAPRAALVAFIRRAARPIDKFSHQARLYRLTQQIGAGEIYDDEVVLKMLALTVAKKVHLEFKRTDTFQHQELRALMQQDPSRPSPVLIIPLLAGGPLPGADDKWKQ